MPHLAFYAAPDDVPFIIEFVLQDCRVFESYSAPDKSLRGLATPVEVRDAFERSAGLGLMIYSPSMKGQFTIERFDLKPGAIPGKSWRERISGWGLIQMELRGVRDGALAPSFTNHNTDKRARAWERTYPQLPPVQEWDFGEVTRISRRINRHIASLGVGKDGPRPVLPGAEAMRKTGGVVFGAA
jgi:hypothetical protein